MSEVAIDYDAALNEAAAALSRAQDAEKLARELRVTAEDKLIELVGLKPEGSQSAKTPYYKITTTSKINRKLDEAKFDALVALHPELSERDLIRVKRELSLSGLRKLQASEPDLYGVVAQAITATPAKPSVKVEVI